MSNPKRLQVGLKVPKLSELLTKGIDKTIVGQFEAVLFECAKLSLNLSENSYFEYFLNLYDQAVLLPSKWKFLQAKRHFLAGELSKALEFASQSISADPHFYDALCLYAELFFKDNSIGCADEAICYLERAMRVHKGSLSHYLMHVYFESKGEAESALLLSHQAFEIMLKECPIDIEHINYFN